MQSFLIYDDSKKSGSGAPISDLDPHVYYERHMQNYFKLKTIFNTSDDFNERQQASSEMQIAERKAVFWRNHSEFNISTGCRILSLLKSAI